MKKSVLASLLAAALASGTAMAQSDPATLPDTAGPGMSTPAGAMDDGSTTAGSSLERSSESYDSGNSGRGAAGRAYDGGTSDGMSGDTSAAGAQGPSSMDNSSGSSSMGGMQGGTMSQDSGSASSPSMSSGSEPSTTGMGTTTTYDSSLGAAGRSYDGSTASGPASRSDVTADRDRALRGGRWIFNDLDGVQRLEPGWNSHAGRVYKGPADSY